MDKRVKRAKISVAEEEDAIGSAARRQMLSHPSVSFPNAFVDAAIPLKSKLPKVPTRIS